jgi:hypothetical protein
MLGRAHAPGGDGLVLRRDRPSFTPRNPGDSKHHKAHGTANAVIAGYPSRSARPGKGLAKRDARRAVVTIHNE